MQTLWVSPTAYVTGDPSLRVSYPTFSRPSTVVTCTALGDKLDLDRSFLASECEY